MGTASKAKSAIASGRVPLPCPASSAIAVRTGWDVTHPARIAPLERWIAPLERRFRWHRVGSAGRRRLDPYPDPGAAINALAALLRMKRRRGYQDRPE
jgi:hypothetical protein